MKPQRPLISKLNTATASESRGCSERGAPNGRANVARAAPPSNSATTISKTSVAASKYPADGARHAHPPLGHRTYFSEDMSMEKRYFTSDFDIRSYA